MNSRIMNENAYKNEISKEIEGLSINSPLLEIDRDIYLGMMQLYRYERIMEASDIEICHEIKKIIADLEKNIEQTKWLISHQNENSHYLQLKLNKYEKRLKEVNVIKDSPSDCRFYLARKQAPFVTEIRHKLDGYEFDYDKRYLLMLGSIISHNKQDSFISCCNKYSDISSTPLEGFNLNIENLDIINEAFSKHNLSSFDISKQDIEAIFSKTITHIKDLDIVRDAIQRIKDAIDELDEFVKDFFNHVILREFIAALDKVHVKDDFFRDNNTSTIKKHFDSIISFIDEIYFPESFMDDDYNFIDYITAKKDIIDFKKTCRKYLFQPQKRLSLCQDINKRLRKTLNDILARYNYYFEHYLNLDFELFLSGHGNIFNEWQSYISSLKDVVTKIEIALNNCESNLVTMYLNQEAELDKIRVEVRNLAGKDFSDFNLINLWYSNEAFHEGYIMFFCHKIMNKYIPLIKNSVCLEADKKEAELRGMSLEALRKQRIESHNIVLNRVNRKTNMYV